MYPQDTVEWEGFREVKREQSQSTEAHPQACQYPESKNRGANDGHHEVGLGLGRPAIPTDTCQNRSSNKGVNLTAVPLGQTTTRISEQARASQVYPFLHFLP
jgi:hypothetical protein